MMKIRIINKGFTVIELLAVIVVLTIILAVAVPRILSVIEEYEKEAFKLSAKNLEKAVRENSTSNLISDDITYTIEDGEFVDNSIPLTGKIPNNGTILVKSNGDIGLAISNSKFCLIKNTFDDEMTVTKDIDNCELILETPSTCFEYNEVSDTEIVITGYDKYYCPLDVIIPETIDEMTVVGIGNRAFDNKGSGGPITPVYKEEDNVVAYNGNVGLKTDNLIASMLVGESANVRLEDPIRSVVFPDTIEYIGDNAFTYNVIKTVKIPNNVESIGEFAFLYNELTSVTIPSSVNEIGKGAFSGNQLPDNKAFIYYRNQDGSIDNSRLLSYGGSKKDNIVIPSNVEIIEEYAFSDSQISSITIHNNVQLIKDFAFQNNQLKSIDIPNNIEIEEDAISYTFNYSYYDHYEELSGNYFALCQDCTWKHSTLDAPPIPTSCFEYYLDGSNEIRIDGYVSNCPKDVVIPSNINGYTVVNIGDDAFYESNIVSLTLPNTIRGIGYYAFSSNQLTTVTIPGSVEYIGSYAFYGNMITNLTLNNGVEEIDYRAFDSNSLTSLIIPNSVYYIANDAFYNNRLTNLVLGTGLEVIGSRAFYGNKLTSVDIPTNVIEIGGGAFSNNLFSDGDAFIYARNSDGSIDNTILVSYAGTKRDNVVIPNSIKVIGEYVFYNLPITSVTIPNGLTDIEDYAFQYAELTSITIPNSVTTIGKKAFYSNRLTNLTIPNSVVTIDNQAFSYNSLNNLTLSNNVTYLGTQCFSDNALTNVTIPNSVTYLGGRAFEYNKLTSVNIPTGITTIEGSTFSVNNLTSIIIPNNITKIGYGAFRYNQLTNITIPSDVDVSKYQSFGLPASISDSFFDAYNPQKQAGTYTAPSQDGIWTKQP